MSQYRIITVCNKRPEQPYYTFDEFFKSLHGEPISLLGVNAGEYGGLGSKPRLLYNAIKSRQIPEKYIIFCDCFDLVFTQKPVKLFERYITFDEPIVISAEKNCFPTDFKEEYDKLESYGSPYKYLNSGMIVGKTEAILAALESMDAENIPNDYWDGEKMVNPNDQTMWQETFLKQPVKMVLDYYQVLCNTLHSVAFDELDFTDKDIKNKITHSTPFSFHLNGSAKTDGLREPLLKHLNLL